MSETPEINNNAATPDTPNSVEPSPTEAVTPQELSMMAELNGALAEAEAKAQENFDQFLRAKAEMENIRRRAAEDVLKAQKFGVEKIAEALLSVKDSLDAALVVENSSIESFKQGVELTARQLTQVFEKFSIVEVNPVGERFDPSKHQAIATVPSEQEPNTVVNVMQKGYLLHGRVIRPALVSVSMSR
ncbi:MAG: nucleotide exchange factor GrpE [Betaproteobacteria bacterium]|nr:nucleotide exchange factor GrpE [Betaproteobacteria bacterium]